MEYALRLSEAAAVAAAAVAAAVICTLVAALAVCSGRVLSYVLDAQSQRLRTRPLFDLLLRSRR